MCKVSIIVVMLYRVIPYLQLPDVLQGEGAIRYMLQSKTNKLTRGDKAMPGLGRHTLLKRSRGLRREHIRRHCQAGLLQLCHQVR